MIYLTNKLKCTVIKINKIRRKKQNSLQIKCGAKSTEEIKCSPFQELLSPLLFFLPHFIPCPVQCAVGLWVDYRPVVAVDSAVVPVRAGPLTSTKAPIVAPVLGRVTDPVPSPVPLSCRAVEVLAPSGRGAPGPRLAPLSSPPVPALLTHPAPLRLCVSDCIPLEFGNRPNKAPLWA